MPAVTLSAVAGAAYETGGSRSYDVVLAAERGLLARRLKVGANLGWASSSTAGAGTVRDLQVIVGAAFEATTAWAFSADYTFRNDVDGEDTGTFAVVRDLPRLKTKLKAGAAKHRVYVLALTRVF